jgi:hypothetical protein
MTSCNFVRLLAKLSQKFPNPLVLLNLFRKLGESGAVLSTESSLLRQNFPVNREKTGKIITNGEQIRFNIQYLLYKFHYERKFNREISFLKQGKK